MIRIRTRSERNQGKEEGEENQLIFGKHVQISAASEESLSPDIGEFVEHCTPASGESSTTAEENKDEDKDKDQNKDKEKHLLVVRAPQQPRKARVETRRPTPRMR